MLALRIETTDRWAQNYRSTRKISSSGCSGVHMRKERRRTKPSYLRGDYLTIFVLAVYLLMGALAFHSGMQQERRNNQPYQYAESDAEDAVEECASRTSSALAECVVERVKAAADQSRSQQNLKAQQQMALWALLMVLVSAATGGVTLWALYYVKQTLDETRRMADDTQKMAGASLGATRAMVRQNELTQASQRPWLDFRLQITRPVELSYCSLCFPIDVHLENYSKTPAICVKAHWTFYPTGVADIGKLRDELIFKALNSTPINETIVYPGVSLYSDNEGASDWCTPFSGDEIPQVGILLFGFTYRGPGDEITRFVFEAYQMWLGFGEHNWKLDRIRDYKKIS